MLRRAAVAVLTIVLPLTAMSGVSSSTAASSARAASTAPAPSLAQLRAMTPNIESMAFAALPQWAPSTYNDTGGASFNNPNGSKASRRRNLDRIKRMVNATPGYRVRYVSQCPRTPPHRIKIALYSFSDFPVADALIAAHRRCVGVNVLMNDHLTNRQVPAYGKLQKYLGRRIANRSWARRCQDGCRAGNGVLHSKMFLFTRTGRRGRVVGFGSSNMTGKAANVQWNDLFFVFGRNGIWNQHQRIFTEMQRDRLPARPIARDYHDGPYLSMFWPQYGHSRSTDRVMREFNKVNCAGRPTNRTGYAGRTMVSINIHAMEADRGLWIAQKIIALHKAGCKVRVLYGLIAPRIHRAFKNNGVPTRRTIFDRDGNGLTEMYTHMKAVSISGRYDGSTGTRVTYTGSENFSNKTVGADEVWVRIPGQAPWSRYQQWFNMIWNSNFYSNPKYAWYSQSDTPVHARQKGAIIVDDEDLER